YYNDPTNTDLYTLSLHDALPIFNGQNTRVRSLHYFVDEKIVKLGDFAAVGALHFDLAAKMVVTRKRVGPDHAEMMFAIRAHKRIDRKSTRLNSSHLVISYAVFCL